MEQYHDDDDDDDGANQIETPPLCTLTSYFRNGVIASLLLALLDWQVYECIGRPGGVWSLGGVCRPGGCYEGAHLFDNQNLTR